GASLVSERPSTISSESTARAVRPPTATVRVKCMLDLYPRLAWDATEHASITMRRRAKGRGMGERTSYTPGTFSWADLSTTDEAGAKQFYSALLGWSFEDVPAGDSAIYTMCRIDGREVAALFRQTEQERLQGVPPHWNSYITVAHVD